MARAYTLKVVAKGDTSHAQGALRKLGSSGGKLNSLKSGLLGVGKAAAVGLGMLALAAAAASIKMIGMGSDAAEVDNKLKVTFGKNLPAMKKRLDAFALATGASTFELRGMAADIGAMVKPLGMTDKAAANMTISVVKLAKDLSSFHNISESDALDKLRSGLAGETEPLRQLGLGFDEAELKAYAYATGLAKVGDELTIAEKTQARFGLIMKKAGKQGALGDATRTANGYANVIRSIKNSVRDAATSFGMRLLPAATRFANLVATFIRSKEFQQWLDSAAASVANMANRFAAWAASDNGKKTMRDVGKAIVATAKVMAAFGRGAVTVIGFVRRHWRLLSAPILLMVAQVRAVWMAFRLGGPIVRAAMSIVRTAVGWVSSAVNGARSAWSSFSKAASSAFGNVMAWINRAITAIGSLASKISSAASKAKSLPGSITPWQGLIPGFAEGGIVSRPTLATVGEAGAEAIIPLTNPRRAAEVMQEAGLAGGGNVYVTINAASSPELTARAVMRALGKGDARQRAYSARVAVGRV